jgi:hypothetical protein
LSKVLDGAINRPPYEAPRRRSFLKRSVAAAAGLGAFVAAPGWVLANWRGADVKRSSAAPTAPALETPIVAYVRDAAKGEVVLLVGETEVVRKDRSLAAHLIECCQA